MLDICFVRDLCRSIQELETAVQKKYNLSLNECMLVCTLSNEGKCSSGRIADMLKLTCSNASKVIKSAEDKGLIKRILGDKDKRRMYFVLTADGECMLQVVANSSENFIPTFLREIINDRSSE